MRTSDYSYRGGRTMQLSKQTNEYIDKLYKGNAHVELSIGILADGKMETLHLGSDRNPAKVDLPVYPVGSICKLFTASLLAKYLHEGKLELETPLSQYIPGLPEKYYPSLKKLATHSSGYGGTPFSTWKALKMMILMNHPGGVFRTNPFHGTIREADMLRILGEKEVKDKVYPFQYSNFGMGVLGYILGKTDGRGYWDAMNAYVREELGLEHTCLGNTDLPGYDKKDKSCPCWPWDKEDIVAPAGALLSSVEDLLKFAQIHMDGTLPYLEICHQKHGEGEKNFDSGLAWRLEKGTDISWHDGAAGAYSAFVGVDRQRKTAVALTVNYGLVDTKSLGFSILNNL